MHSLRDLKRMEKPSGWRKSDVGYYHIGKIIPKDGITTRKKVYN